MSKAESALDIVRRVLDKEMPMVLKEVMDDKKLTVERKAGVISNVDSVMSMLRVVRANLEV